MFEDSMRLIIVPSYRARENESLEDLTPEKLCKIINHPSGAIPETLGHSLKKLITKHVKDGNLVLCLSAGGGGSLDEWLRKEFNQK
jgi:UDP-N-acetylmuramate-alanine ligase